MRGGGSARDLAVQALREPCSAAELSPAQWNLLIRQARNAGTLGRLHAALAEGERLGQVPQAVRQHLLAAARLAEKQKQSARWEIARIREALAGLGRPVILLKGGAYLAAGLPPARGRIFADIDILVPASVLAETEKRLMVHGWMAEAEHAYDQRYYRQWMHELPPMRHARRGTILDVHHNLLPRTSRHAIDAGPLIEAAVPLPDDAALAVLAPVDMVLHSIVHLFLEGEYERGLRDLADIDDLIRHFSADASFAERLGNRALELGLERPLHYALTWRETLLGTPIPAGLADAVRLGTPGVPTAAVMDRLLGLALHPSHPSCDRALTGLARGLLYLRGHWLRMPVWLLVPHLIRKALRRSDAT